MAIGKNLFVCLASVVVSVSYASPLQATVNAASSSWAGTLEMPPFVKSSPMNVTVTGSSADFTFVYDKDASGRTCHPDTLSNLAYSVSGNDVTFTGTGKDPSFYTFKGTIMSTGKISGSMYNPKSVGGGHVGTFSISQNAPMVASTCHAPPPPPPPPAPTVTTHAYIWPLPKEYTNGTTTVTVTPSTGFFQLSNTNAFMTTAFGRYTALTFPHAMGSSVSTADGDGVTGLSLTIASMDDSHPQIDTDETYTLNVPVTGAATLSAKTVYGALRGLETFSQLVTFDFDSETYVVKGAPWAINDAPRFPHRGLMIDSARHFETLASIRMMIDSLPYAKLNVLHWHMSDTQSFPFEVKSYPKLWDAAWSEVEKFTQADVASIVEYARLRGVRVIVEFDMPGHAGSWCTGYPEVCPSLTCNQPLNVANNATFDLIESLLKECTGGVASTPGNPSPGLFKDNFIHLGGDEVDTACWESTPAVAQWLAEHKMTADQGYAYFVKRASDIAISQGHRPVQWSEVYDHFGNNLTKQTIVHIWKSVTNVTEVVAGGYNVLVNVGYDKLSWYLDNLAVMWDAVYLNEPCVNVPDDLCPLVLGGHGEMWGETVDASDIQQTVWPRLAAISERLWSPRELVSTEDAHQRIEGFRCLLNRRGIAAAPLNNANARSSPGGPGSCLLQ